MRESKCKICERKIIENDHNPAVHYSMPRTICHRCESGMNKNTKEHTNSGYPEPKTVKPTSEKPKPITFHAYPMQRSDGEWMGGHCHTEDFQLKDGRWFQVMVDYYGNVTVVDERFKSFR